MPVDGAGRASGSLSARMRWILVVATVTALLLAGLAAHDWWTQTDDAPVVQALSSVADPGRHTAPAAAPEQVLASASMPSSAASRAAVPDPSCPAPWRALAGQPADAIDKVFRRLRPAALAHAGQLLSTSSEAFERIAGRLLLARSRDVDSPPDAETYLALVSEALSSNDPRLAALATQLCDTAPPEHAAACSSMSASRWAAVDPDNVQAWLAVAAEALERTDPRTAREALARAAQARTSRLIWSDLMPLSNSPALQALSPVDRQVLAADLVGVGSMLGNNGLLAISRLCSVDALHAAQRRQECSAIAGLMIDHGDTLIEHGIGIGLARRAGWPSEQIDPLAEEQRALSEALGEETNFALEQAGPMTEAQACETYRRVEAAFALVSSGNELQVARRALQRRQATAAAPP
ncbi:hypothetical protein AACH06_17180 [Ideonella sp. DXS29W]|uniref:Uncharacterized protein n=1 Tax=Ideonella lacteola TaxID=2984193 RepID=A0ABU9BRH2_9BURK